MWLQQLLPFTVLKPFSRVLLFNSKWLPVATALTVYGIETLRIERHVAHIVRCNSSYRLRY